MPAKWIEGFENLYTVDEEGTVRSYKTGKGSGNQGLAIKPSLNTKGYPQVRIYNADSKGYTFRVHRLVADAFIDNPLDYPQVDHIDGDKTNNHVTNLQWVTNQMNCSKALAKVHYLQHKNGSGLFVNNFTQWCKDMRYDRATFDKMRSNQRKSAYGFIHMEVM